MFIPKGHTEETVLAAMTKVLNQLCRTFRFGYYDAEDMKQEGYIYGMEALPRYNSELSNLETFLRHHIRNRFISLKRDKLERRAPPCFVCPFYDPDNEYICNEFDDQNKCDRWRGWVSRNQSKRNLMETSIYNEEDNVLTIQNMLDQLITQETLDMLDKQMPIDLRGDYRRLIDGAMVPKGRRDKVYEAARQILKVYNDG